MASSSKVRQRFFVGVNTGYVTNDQPDERFVDFYRQRASALLDCAILGNVVIPGGYGSNASTPRLTDDPVWETVATAIAERGTRPGIQLATAWEGYEGVRSFRSTAGQQTISAARKLVAGLSEGQIDTLLEALERGSDLAIAAGFRHIQLHAAHGYLFSLLIDLRINQRAGRVLGAVGQWAKRLGTAKIESSIRVSLRTGDAMFDVVGGDEFLESIAQLPVDFVDVSSGFYNIDKQLIYPGRPDMLKDRRDETIKFAERFPSKQFIYSGRSASQDMRSLPVNIHIGLCRDLIANPDFLSDPARGCVNSGQCHYFSRGEDHMTCRQW